MSDCRCGGTGVVIGEPRGHDADGNLLFVHWACDCRMAVVPADKVSQTGVQTEQDAARIP